MRLAIMQPYLFPYLGYFQLAASVDRFVVYDDVTFIKNGWINRNRILLASAPHYLTVPLAGASSSRRIDEVRTQPRERWLGKLLEQLRHAYGRAPQYVPVSRLVEQVLSDSTDSIARLAAKSVIDTCAYLGLETTFVTTSTGYGNEALRSEARVIDICAREHAGTYVNLPGGRALYDAGTFAAASIDLEFVDTALPAYPQFGAPFVPGLSIIDVLMFNHVESVHAMLSREAITA
ncbi:WbqC family protein [Cupriavidus metallidurans]|uniref:WbqC family protein n=1 Tax=Cupriavidus metallidurans (strain ATCC 43123 / DSM 2839 / NBRC 102507 / CH34) TaxID=266264 RepID=Q1LCN0_CUPMC|nr:WbqC family protein [Cupriavidus metallidurans]ABF12096.1 conserved hypothetical protein [Cupriavidus metallidurans CH34]QGS32643.1 hypothetical protein FOB83_27920 [Cupriavidus metallidurans]